MNVYLVIGGKGWLKDVIGDSPACSSPMLCLSDHRLGCQGMLHACGLRADIHAVLQCVCGGLVCILVFAGLLGCMGVGEMPGLWQKLLLRCAAA